MIRVAFTKIGEKYDFDWEIRNKLMRLAVLVFGFAILLLFKPLLPIFEIILILLCVSIFVAILYHAYKLIRRIIGYY
jgi:predicted tellurium resistance membrane protein TerC